MPNENMAKSFSKTRWIPYLNDCAEMQKQIPRTTKGLVDRYRFGFLEQAATKHLLGARTHARVQVVPVALHRDDAARSQPTVAFEVVLLLADRSPGLPMDFEGTDDPPQILRVDARRRDRVLLLEFREQAARCFSFTRL